MREPDVFRVSTPFTYTWYFSGWDKQGDIRQVKITLIPRLGKVNKDQIRLRGLGIDYSKSYIDHGIRTTYLEDKDITYNKGLIWLPGGSICAVINRDRYHLVTINSPFFPPDYIFVSFSKKPHELTNSRLLSTFIRQEDNSW